MDSSFAVRVIEKKSALDAHGGTGASASNLQIAYSSGNTTMVSW
jgi:hypothetical protein